MNVHPSSDECTDIHRSTAEEVVRMIAEIYYDTEGNIIRCFADYEEYSWERYTTCPHSPFSFRIHKLIEIIFGDKQSR